MGRPATGRGWKTFKWKLDLPNNISWLVKFPTWDDNLSKESSTETQLKILLLVSLHDCRPGLIVAPFISVSLQYQSWKYQSIKVERQSACMTSGQEGKGCHVRLSRVDKTGGAILPTLPGFVLPSLLLSLQFHKTTTTLRRITIAPTIEFPVLVNTKSKGC